MINKKFEYKEEYQYLTSAMLNVTDDCNLQCRYCFVEQHPHYMSFETAKAAVNWLYNNYLKKKEIVKEVLPCYCYFFGGEPTLCFDTIIKPIVEYVKNNFPENSFRFGMTTNGTLLNKERIDFLKQNNFNLLLSIDGEKETQDFNRPCRNGQSSFDLLKNNITYLLEQFPELCFRSTGYPQTIHNMFNNYLYAESLGFKNWLTIIDQRSTWNEIQKENLSKEIRKIYFYRLQQIANGITPMRCHRIDDFLKYAIELLQKNSDNFFNIEKSTNIMRCGLATTNGAIGYDGSIYGCQEQPSKDKKNIFLIGNIFNGGIDKEKHFNLLNTYFKAHQEIKLKFPKCEKCYLYNFCNFNLCFDCPSTAFDLFNDITAITDIQCYKDQELFKNSLLILKILEYLDADTQEKFISKILSQSQRGN